MWEHPAVAANVATLRARGVTVMEPDRGALASGLSGRGRLPEPESIVAALASVLAPAQDLTARRSSSPPVPTREADRSRALHLQPLLRKDGLQHRRRRAAPRRRRHAGVGAPPRSRRPAAATSCPLQTAEEMREAVLAPPLAGASIVINAAAPSPTTACAVRRRSRSRASANLTLELTPNPDILAEVAAGRSGAFVVGFAAETNDCRRQRAREARGQGHRSARRQRREPGRHRLRRRRQRGAADRPLGRQPRAARAWRRARSPTRSSARSRALRRACRLRAAGKGRALSQTPREALAGALDALGQTLRFYRDLGVETLPLVG